MCAQGVVVSLGKGPRGLSEHRGGYDSSHSWQGLEDLDVAVLASLRVLVRRGLELVEQGLQTLAATLTLAVDQPQAWQQQANMFSGSLDHAGATWSAGTPRAAITSAALTRRMRYSCKSSSMRLIRRPCAAAGEGASSSKLHNQGSSAAGQSLRACT